MAFAACASQRGEGRTGCGAVRTPGMRSRIACSQEPLGARLATDAWLTLPSARRSPPCRGPRQSACCRRLRQCLVEFRSLQPAAGAPRAAAARAPSLTCAAQGGRAVGQTQVLLVSWRGSIGRGQTPVRPAARLALFATAAYMARGAALMRRAGDEAGATSSVPGTPLIQTEVPFCKRGQARVMLRIGPLDSGPCKNPEPPRPHPEQQPKQPSADATHSCQLRPSNGGVVRRKAS